jgi:hypothetical protein
VADCGRYRSPDAQLQACEFQRDEQADILDAARRPPAGRLGSQAIRFSTRPEAGFRALVVEIAHPGRSAADVRIFTFTGHARLGWEPEDEDHLTLSDVEYRQLAAQIDLTLATYGPPIEEFGIGDGIVCMDGPGFLTERVQGGTVRTLVGSCPPSMTMLHANSIIAAAIQDMLCRQHNEAAERVYWSGRRCFEPQLTMAQWQARGDGQ